MRYKAGGTVLNLFFICPIPYLDEAAVSSAAASHGIQRTITKKTVKPVPLNSLMTREIFTIPVAEKPAVPHNCISGVFFPDIITYPDFIV